MEGSVAYGDEYFGDNDNREVSNARSSRGGFVGTSRELPPRRLMGRSGPAGPSLYGGASGGHIYSDSLEPRDTLLMVQDEETSCSSFSSNSSPTPSSPPPECPRPGVAFCSLCANDPVVAKIAALDGKPTASAAPVTQIEIAPGVTTHLRGTQETLRAIEKDFYMPTRCFCCQLDLLCIMDANYVLCPDCRVVSPMEGCATGFHNGGVGLGFTYPQLQECQNDILATRRRMRAWSRQKPKAHAQQSHE